jgi:hypothetical protein
MAGDGKKKKGAKPDSVRQRKYNSRPEQKKRRAQRNQARREAIKDGRVGKGDGKDIDHKNKGSKKGKLDNSKSNLRVRSASANRADNRGTGGRKKKRS